MTTCIHARNFGNWRKMIQRKELTVMNIFHHHYTCSVIKRLSCGIQPFQQQLMSDAIRHIFCSPSLPILLVGYFGFGGKVAQNAVNTPVNISPKFFGGEPLTHPLPMEKGHYCVSVTTITPWPAFNNPPSCIHTSLQQCRGNGITVFFTGHHR